MGACSSKQVRSSAANPAYANAGRSGKKVNPPPGGCRPGLNWTPAGGTLPLDLEKIGLLGCGGFGAVELCRHSSTGEIYALKSLSKGVIVKVGLQRNVFNEKRVMQRLCSPFAIKLHDTFNSSQYLYFLIEAALGGELYSTYKRWNLHGNVACNKFHVAGVVCGLEHIHDRCVLYRGVNPENILLSDSGCVKLCDFGLSKVLNPWPGQTFTTCGVPDYFAPEMIAAKGHNHAVDWWCLGVLTFELLNGFTPFESAYPVQIYDKVVRGMSKVSFPKASRGSAKELIMSLAKQNPDERLPMLTGGTDNLKRHNWYRGFDWVALADGNMVPPYRPTVCHAADMSNFAAREEDRPKCVLYKDDETCWDVEFATVDNITERDAQAINVEFLDTSVVHATVMHHLTAQEVDQDKVVQAVVVRPSQSSPPECLVSTVETI